MGKEGSKDPLAKARKKLGRAQTRYTKAVAKGEREIRNVRARADERIARAKAEFELCASELAEAENHAGVNGAKSPVEAADAVEVAALQVAKPDKKLVAPNGSRRKAAATASTPVKAQASKRSPRTRPQK